MLITRPSLNIQLWKTCVVHEPDERRSSPAVASQATLSLHSFTSSNLHRVSIQQCKLGYPHTLSLNYSSCGQLAHIAAALLAHSATTDGCRPSINADTAFSSPLVDDPLLCRVLAQFVMPNSCRWQGAVSVTQGYALWTCLTAYLVRCAALSIQHAEQIMRHTHCMM